MKLQESFWVSGLMPVQFLLVLTVAFLGFVFTHFLLKRMGKRVPVFGQAILIFFTTFLILKYVIQPPILSSPRGAYHSGFRSDSHSLRAWIKKRMRMPTPFL